MDALLKAYADSYQILIAAKKAGINRATHYKWLRKCPTYAAVFKKRKLAAAEYVESKAVERATTGWFEPVYYQGSVCGRVKRYDGGLMQFLLRGMMPEKYGTKTEISGPQGAPVQVNVKVNFVKPSESDSA